MKRWQYIMVASLIPLMHPAAIYSQRTVEAGKIVSLASTEGYKWYAAAGVFTPEREKQNKASISAYREVSVPANLVPQIGLDGRQSAHYRVRFALTEVPKEPYALRLGEINDRDRTWVNGQLIGATGVWDSALPQAYDKVRIYNLPSGVLVAGENEIILEVQGVLDAEAGLYRDRVEIGPAQAIYRAYYLENLWSLLALVCYLTFGLYFLLFFIRRRHDRENLYFGIFALALVVYSALHTQLKYEYGLSLYIWKKVQYLALFVLVPAFYHFIRNYYTLPQARWVRLWDFISYSANAVIAAVGLAVVFLSEVRYWDFLHNNVVTYVWLVYIVGMAVILGREAYRRNRDAIIMLTSFMVLLVAMILDILSGRALINLPPLLTYVFILFIVAMALVLANRFVRLHDETEALNENLSRFNAASRRFVPFEFLEMLEKRSILDVSLGDQVQREMTVLFSDIRSFTALSERMTPKENFDFINSYLDKVGPIIRHHRGFIDKYIGDAVMALFADNPGDALAAAVDMHRSVMAWNERRRVHGYQDVEIGIGIHHGRVMLGTIGEHERMDGTVISDAVNLASRIESLTKHYGAGILLSETTWQRIAEREQYSYRLVDRVAVKGKKQPVALIEVFDCDNPASRELKLRQRAAFSSAVELYQRGELQEAKTAFLGLIAANGDDKALSVYLERVERYLRQPVDEWRGYEILNEK